MKPTILEAERAIGASVERSSAAGFESEFEGVFQNSSTKILVFLRDGSCVMQ